MANYYGTSRSNYFKVKNKEKFTALCEKLGVQLIEQGNLVGFISNSEDGSLPSSIYDEKTGDQQDIDLCNLISKHLCKGQVAVMVESGAEKHRYVVGYATAVNWEGKTESIGINNIYDLAKKKFGVKKVTVAEY